MAKTPKLKNKAKKGTRPLVQITRLRFSRGKRWASAALEVKEVSTARVRARSRNSDCMLKKGGAFGKGEGHKSRAFLKVEGGSVRG